MADNEVEHEICGNCKKEIPHFNYVMHTAHCSRNITLCKTCKEPIAKSQFEQHEKKCQKRVTSAKEPPKSTLEKSDYYQKRAEVERVKQEEKRERYLERNEKFLTKGYSMTKTTSNEAGAVRKLLACRYCDLELPKTDLEEHENYCGSRTDKCLECGELVMFKDKATHSSTHIRAATKDNKPKPSWDSNTERELSPPRRRRFEPTVYTDFSQFDPTDYLPSNYQIPKPKIDKGESYKEISRRLDCKTEYIRNLLHDSASITVPLRTNGTVPRNQFYHNKGDDRPSRRRNPPTELTIPCEFCDTPIPHEELILHETGCRPDLACRRSKSFRSKHLDDYDDDDVDGGASASSPEVELPCEFCSDMIPASQLLRHQATCSG